MPKWTLNDLPPQVGRRALVTGAASGLGLDTAKALAAAGAHVILSDRNVDAGEAAAGQLRASGAQAEFRALDLGDLAAIRRFAETVRAEGTALDLLVNNAGLLPPLQRAATRDGFELKFGVSHLGHFALTDGLLPALLQSKARRVVSVSSLVHAHGKIDFDDLQAEKSYEPQRAYNQTKLACLIFALELQARADTAGVALTSVAAHPGVARTAIGNQRKTDPPRRLQDRLELWSFNMAMKYFGQSAGDGALPILYAATMPDVKGGEFFGPDGFMEFSGYPKRVRPSRLALDTVVRTRLWEVSERLTGARYDALVRPI